MSFFVQPGSPLRSAFGTSLDPVPPPPPPPVATSPTAAPTQAATPSKMGSQIKTDTSFVGAAAAAAAGMGSGTSGRQLLSGEK